MPSLSSLFFKRTSFAFAVLVLSFLAFVNASSAPQRPLKRITQPSIHRLEILPRSSSIQRRSQYPPTSVPSDSPVLQHSDSFRLTLSAFEQTFHLHLQPNPYLLHPSARINHYKTGPNGQAVLDRTVPLLRENVKAYWGDVIHPDGSFDRMREDTVGGLLNSDSQPLGWARIVVHHQGHIDTGVPPVFEGAFSVNGVTHHVTTKEKYMRTKHPLDPQPLSHIDDPSSPLVMFRDSDIMNIHEEAQFKALGVPFTSFPGDILDGPHVSEPGVLSCSHDHLEWNTDPRLNPTLRRPPNPPTWFDKFGFFDDFAPAGVNVSAWVKRDDVAGNTGSQNFAGSIGQSAGCPIQQQIVYMGVAADCTYVQQYGSTSNATSAILNDWNLASGLYKTTFNVSLGILHIDMHDPVCPSTPDPSTPWNVGCSNDIVLNDRLSLFSKWRGDRGPDGTGLWHLMSGCPTGTEVGVAWLGTLCQITASGSTGNVVSGTAVTTGGKAEWQVVAHEIGHNFGAIHDCVSGCNSTSPCCPLSTGQCDSNSQFIMSPTASQSESHFSQCSLGNICSLMQSKTMNDTCVQPPNPSQQTLSLQMCGNGIVESGEDCDPGQGNNSTCCNTATCKFTAGSVCDPSGSACCTEKCQFAPSTQVCRPSQDSSCDIAESCTGTSADCPWDKTQPDGQSCGGNGLACASGKCTSPSQQCQTIGAAMGLTTACPNKGDTSCQVSCEDPSNSRQCVVLQAQLTDGSPCGYGGKCTSSGCKPGSIFDTIKAWYVANLQISIPVTVVAGIVLLFILYGLFRCFARCCCGGRRDAPSEPALRAVPAQRLGSWVGPPLQPSGPEPGVWIPPPAGSTRGIRDHSIRSGRSLGGIPPVLQAGSAASQRNVPSTSTNTRAAYGAQDSRYPRLPTGPSDQSGRRSRNSDGTPSHWVDPTAWNGPTR